MLKVFLCTLLVLNQMTASSFPATESSCLFPKSKKIVVSPPESKIYIDVNYVSDGTFMLTFKRDDFCVVKVEYTGYVTKEIKVFKDDSRKTISITLREDDAFAESEMNALANQFFTIQVRENIDGETAWKIINQTVLNYFDEIKVADRISGFLNTAWVILSFPSAEVNVRTRVQIKEITTGSGLAYQIKVCSEIGSLMGGEQSYKLWDRLLKKYEPLINEIQVRLK